MSEQKKKGQIPHLRFRKDDGSVFPYWKTVKLKCVAKRQKAKNKGQKITRVLTNSAIDGVVDQRDYFDKDIAVKGNLEGYFIVDKGAYVYNPRISKFAPVGPVSKNKLGKGVMSPLYTVFRFDRENNDFYEHFFKSQKWHKYLQRISNSGARHDRMSISADDFISMPVPYPDEDEQQKIAECLTSIDDLITAYSQKLDVLTVYKKGLMKKLFPAEDETTPKLRFSEFKDEGEWEIHSIDALIDKGALLPPKDGNHGNIHPRSSDYIESGIPFIMASDIQYGNIDLIGCSKISKAQADKLQKGFAQEGDVLLTHKGTVGEVALVGKIEYPYLMLTPQVTYYRIKNKEILSNQFLEYSFTSERFQKNLAIASGGGTRSYIGIIEQRKLTIIFPTNFKEQQKIAFLLSSVDDILNTNRQKIEILKAHKIGLMQQLFPTVDEVAT